MERVRLTPIELYDAFGETLPSLIRAKRKELKAIEIDRCGLIDKYRNDPSIEIHLIMFDDTSGYAQIQKEIANMTRITGIGSRKHRSEIGMMTLPLIEVKQIPILEAFDFKKTKKTGRRTMVSCLFHDDHTPSALINTNNTYKCFSCGFTGDVIALTQKLYGLDFVSAVKKLQKSNGGVL